MAAFFIPIPCKISVKEPHDWDMINKNETDKTMCGRFVFFTDKDYHNMLLAMEQDLPGLKGTQRINPTRGDIYPSQNAPVIHEHSGSPEVSLMTWGYANPHEPKKLLINARSETAASRPTFRQDFNARRCIIPATGFYEWDSKKNKCSFTDEQGLLYLGGLYTPPEHGTSRFIILTKAPDAVVSPVHNRMPVLVPGRLAEDWLTNTALANDIIQDGSIHLNRYGDKEQLSFI